MPVGEGGTGLWVREDAVFMASVRIARHFGRPGTPNDQAWIESFFGHVKDEFPHLDLIGGLGDLEAELDRIRVHYNTVRLHQGLGYVTPDDEHHGRGHAIRDARVKGMRAAAEARIAFRRQLRQDPP
jgi:putative transposase